MSIGGHPVAARRSSNHFATIAADEWRSRFERGRVLDASHQPLSIEVAYREGLRVHYYREVAAEPRIPFESEYAAIAPALPHIAFPLTRNTRLERGEPFVLTREVAGTPNAQTRIEVTSAGGAWWRYALFPETGKKHQLRVHMAALGAPIRNDDFYPALLERDPYDFSRPLQLLARGSSFVDPVSGAQRSFVSALDLESVAGLGL